MDMAIRSLTQFLSRLPHRGARRALLACLALLTLFLGPWSEPLAARETHPAQASAAPAEAAHPALWRIQRGGTTIWLFGTVHVLPPALTWYAGPVARAFEGSDTLVTEIIEKSPEEMRALVAAKAILPQGPSLRDSLPVADRHLFEKALVANGLPPASFDRFRPWYAAVALSTLPLMRSGYDPANGVDARLAQRAAALGRGHEALETAEYQLGLFDSLPADLQRRYLHEVVTGLPTINRELAGMVSAWKAGDPVRLAKLMNADEDDPRLKEILLLARNRAWAKWIKARLDAHLDRAGDGASAKPETLFIAVGAGHLAGAGCVQDQLRRLGITAVRVQ